MDNFINIFQGHRFETSSKTRHTSPRITDICGKQLQMKQGKYTDLRNFTDKIVSKCKHSIGILELSLSFYF